MKLVIVCYTRCIELVLLTLRTLDYTNMATSIADRLSLLIAEMDDALREEQAIINKHMARCKELVEELDSLEHTD